MAGPQQLSPRSGTPGPWRSRAVSLFRRRTPCSANRRPAPWPGSPKRAACGRGCAPMDRARRSVSAKVHPDALPKSRQRITRLTATPRTTNKRPAPPERRTRCRSRPACWTPSCDSRRRARTRTCGQHHRLLAVLNEESTHRSAQGATPFLSAMNGKVFLPHLRSCANRMEGEVGQPRGCLSAHGRDGQPSRRAPVPPRRSWPER
jgi:hypothetical protein